MIGLEMIGLEMIGLEMTAADHARFFAIGSRRTRLPHAA
jgi:hypothetical protein